MKSPFEKVRPFYNNFGRRGSGNRRSTLFDESLALSGHFTLSVSSVLTSKGPQRAQKGPKEPQSTQEGQTERNDDFLTPADQSYVQNAETFQKGFSCQKGPKEPKKGPKEH